MRQCKISNVQLRYLQLLYILLGIYKVQDTSGMFLGIRGTERSQQEISLHTTVCVLFAQYTTEGLVQLCQGGLLYRRCNGILCAVEQYLFGYQGESTSSYMNKSEEARAPEVNNSAIQI